MTLAQFPQKGRGTLFISAAREFLATEGHFAEGQVSEAHAELGPAHAWQAARLPPGIFCTVFAGKHKKGCNNGKDQRDT